MSTSQTPDVIYYYPTIKFICRLCGRVKEPTAAPNNYTCQCRAE